MYIVFTLMTTEGTYATDKSPIVTIYVNGVYDQSIDSSVDEIDAGDYALNITEPSSYNYMRIHITCDGCLEKRFTVYPEESSTATIDAATVAAIRDGLATSSEVSDAKEDIIAASPSIDTAEIAKAVWNYAESNPETGVLGTRTLSTAVEVNPVEIARAVWNYSDTNQETGVLGTRTLTESFPSPSDIASAVLTTNVAPLTVDTKEYTLKHLIMATQRSYVTEGESPHWVICAGDVDSQGNLKDITQDTIIAKRTLKLNGNGAIVKTE